jgi:hypothetical protein
MKPRSRKKAPRAGKPGARCFLLLPAVSNYSLNERADKRNLWTLPGDIKNGRSEFREMHCR